MDSVHILWDVRNSKGDEDEKLIDVYRTEQDARSAIERLKNKPGFRQTQDAFEINRYILNQDHWETGFFGPPISPTARSIFTLRLTDSRSASARQNIQRTHRILHRL
jgi:hypothetical protein